MRALLFGYHNVGCVGLKALLANGYSVPAVFTHADDPNENTWFDSLAFLAAEKGIKVFAPFDINRPEWVEKIRELDPDIIFSFYYRNMIKSEILGLPPQGCLNLHGSYLPAYRGRCPVNWVLVNGEKQSGATLHYMTEKPDQGDIVDQESFLIEPDDTALDLHHKLAHAAGTMLNRALPLIKEGKARPRHQDQAKVTYFGGRGPKDGLIDWQMPAQRVHDLVRAVTIPYPGAFYLLGSKKMFVWRSKVVSGNEQAVAGTVLSTSPLIIACGKDALQVVVGQAEGQIYMGGEQLSQILELAPGLKL
ncbi:formyltransferase, partial [Dethiosulfatarculus sandiegensis]|uniref:formyltransferase n=1 Tax=Dethiosulfatarculus sandiegensis TaxID=1429043 RepID=UPI0005C86681